MAKSVTVFDPGQMPAHIAAFLDDKENDNIADRSSVPTLAYGGKRWAITIAGEKTQLMKTDADGEEVPLPIMRVIIIDFAKERGRAYYEGAYDPDKVSAPACWSDDGKVPHPSIEEPQSKKCDGCPQSVKGSRVTDANKASYACSQHRMLAVSPASRIDELPVLRLKIAITSDWDKADDENSAKDWYAFRQYLDFLRSRGIKNTAAVITKMKFDGNTDYPKLLFQAGGWTSPEALVKAVALAKEDDTQKLLGGTWTPAGADGKKVEDKTKLPADDDEEVAGPTSETPRTKTKAPVDDEDDGPKAPARAATGKKAAVVDDEDDGTVIPPGKGSRAADAAKPVAATVVDDEDEDEEAAALKALEAAKAKKAAKAEAAKPAATANPKRAAAAAAAAAKPKAAVVDDEDEGETAPASAKPAKPAAAAPAVNKAVPKTVGDLLKDWDED